MSLTIKQEKFALAYVRLGNASDAYRAAYAVKKMTNKSINEEASNLLANPKITSRVSELLAPAVEASQLSADRILEELSKAAYSAPVDDIKWADKLSAIDKSMKHLGLFEKDNSQINKPVSINMVFE